MPSSSVSAPATFATSQDADRCTWWPVVAALVVNLLMSLPLAVAVTALVDPGYSSDPDVVHTFTTFLLILLAFIEVGATLLCAICAEGRRLAVLLVAPVGLVLPAALIQPWA